jgi:hypothetical protein
VKSVHPV